MPFYGLLNSQNKGKRTFFSYRAQYDVLIFQSGMQKNEAKLSSFEQFENEMASYHALQRKKSQLPLF